MRFNIRSRTRASHQKPGNGKRNPFQKRGEVRPPLPFYPAPAPLRRAPTTTAPKNKKTHSFICHDFFNFFNFFIDLLFVIVNESRKLRALHYLKTQPFLHSGQGQSFFFFLICCAPSGCWSRCAAARGAALDPNVINLRRNLRRGRSYRHFVPPSSKRKAILSAPSLRGAVSPPTCWHG